MAIGPGFGQVDRDQFRGNVAYFLRIDRRPHSLERKEGRGHKAQSGWTLDKIRHFDLLVDNLYHAKALLEELSKYPPAKVSGSVSPNRTWLRMVALVSLYYGCLAEPGIFVSAMDRLLHDIATFYGMFKVL